MPFSCFIKLFDLSSRFIFFSGSTIVGIGSPDPPQFVNDDDEYQDVFLSGKTYPRFPATRDFWIILVEHTLLESLYSGELSGLIYKLIPVD